MNPQDITALYTRTSQETDDAFSVDSQIKAGRPFAEANSLTIPEGYEFREDFTGKALERPELNRLLKLVKERKVTNVIIYAVDRLARKIGVADMLLDEFMENSVKLWIVQWGSYVKNTPEDRLRFNFEATFSDFERRKIMERTMRGKKNKLSQGIYLGTGRPPYGYTKEGRKRDTVLVVCEEQAEVIRQIFTWYAVDRINASKIVELLAGTPTPGESKGFYPKTIRGKGNWPPTTVYHILRDSTYTGVDINHGQTIQVPQIVDPDLFALAQKRLDDGKFLSPRNTKNEYLMAKRLRCQRCGYRIEPAQFRKRNKPPTFYYRCPSWRPDNAKPKCGLLCFRVDVLDGVVWKWVKNLLLDPQSLRAMLEESQGEMEARNTELKERIARLDTRLQGEKRRFAVLVTEYAESLSLGSGDGQAMVREIFKQQKDTAAQTIEELMEERTLLAGELQAVSISDDVIEGIEAFTQTTEEDLNNLPFEGRHELIEALGIHGQIDQEEDTEGKMVQVIYIHLYTHKFRRVLTDSCSSTEYPARRTASRSAARPSTSASAPERQLATPEAPARPVRPC